MRVNPGNIRWSRTPSGGMRAELTIGGTRYAGEATAEEYAAEQNAVGFKLSLKSLGRALKSVVSPTAVMKLASTASAVIDGIPQVKQALGGSKEGQAVLAGLAGLKVMGAAKAGDPRAQAIVQRAESVAQMSPAEQSALPPPVTPEGEIVRYLVALQRMR